MIRKYRDNDLESIMKIWKEENEKAHYFIPKEYWENHYKWVKNRLPKSEIWVYLVNDEIAGFIGVNGDFIEGIFVKEQFQHKKIGTQLIKKVMKQKIKLSLMVYEKNEKAKDFYHKNFFQINDRKMEQETGEYEYFMEWHLKEGD